MKRPAFYRRSGKQNTRLAGIKERAVWRLSKGPATGAELAETFGISLKLMHNTVATWMRQGKQTITFNASEWVELPNGERDRTYSLGSKVKRVTPQGEEPIFMVGSLKNSSPEVKKLNTERAKRRARLIAAGLYIDEFN